jgi:hypothetical protein
MATWLRRLVLTAVPACGAIALLVGCSRDKPDPAGESAAPVSLLDLVEQQGTTPTDVQSVEFTLTTPQPRGVVDFYRLVGSDLAKLERLPFEQAPVRSVVRYQTETDVPESVLLAHVSTLGEPQPEAAEYVCMARIPHTGNRHHVELRCDLPSTLSFYMAAARIGQSGGSPFVDVVERLDRWQAIEAARGDDLIAFLLSAFATLHAALLDMGEGRFTPEGQSIRPVMETVVARALEQYQRNGRLSGTDLVRIADEVTGGSLPLARLTRFPDVYATFAHVEPITLSDLKGHLTRRDRVADAPTLQAELTRFFVRDAPLELSDPRTHVPQSVRHSRDGDQLLVEWHPLPHMDGYSVYLNGEFVRTTRQPRVALPAAATGTVMIRAVGAGGEYPGHRHSLSESAPEGPSA